MKHKFLHNWLIIIFIVIILLIIGGILFLNYWPHASQTAKHDSPRIGQPSHNLKIDGRWRKKNTAAVKKNGQQFEKEVKRLQSLGYLQGYHNGPTKNGVTLYNKSLAYGGLNFFTSGHAQAAFLMDMQGKIIHQWDLKNPLVKKRLESIIKSQDDPKIRAIYREACTYWRRAHLYDNGDILAIYSQIFMIKLDKDSNLVWISDITGTHHHMQVADNGNIYVLVKKNKSIPKPYCLDKKCQTDFIVVLNPRGEVIKSISLLECFVNSEYTHLLRKMPKKNEQFHTNTLQLFDGHLSDISPLFKKGNALISALYLNTIAIVDLDKEKVVWALEGSVNDLWSGMHEPVLLDNGNILIFDNNWTAPKNKRYSRVLEFDPFTKEIVWQYRGGKQQAFFSRTCGTNQRLPNGNTLITESDNGRVFEVTSAGKIVWEYINPHRAGKNNQFIATILHMQRIDQDKISWIDNAKAMAKD